MFFFVTKYLKNPYSIKGKCILQKRKKQEEEDPNVALLCDLSKQGPMRR